MESKPKMELLKIAGKDGEVAVDLTGRANGRGVYLCKNKDCLALAQKKRAIPRSLHMEISQERMEVLFAEIESILEGTDDKK